MNIFNKLSLKKSALVRSKILGLFVKLFTAKVHVFSSQYADFHVQKVQKPLSLKQKTFSG